MDPIRELDALAEGLAAVRRQPFREEAPVELTNGYVHLLFAIGYARLGAHARVRERLEYGRAELAGEIRDPVHAWLVAALEARVEQALAHRPPGCGLPAGLAEQRRALERVPRYKIDRFREASRLLEPLCVPDAIGLFSRFNVGVMEIDDPAPGLLERRAEPAGADALIAELPAIPAPQRHAAMLEILAALAGFREADAMPIVVRALPLVPKLPAPRLRAAAATLHAIARHGWGELVPQILPLLRTELAAHDGGPELVAAFSIALRALDRLGLAEELRQMIDLGTTRIETMAGADLVPGTQQVKLMLLGAACALDDPAALAGLAERAQPPPVYNLEMHLASHRSLAIAYAHAGPEHGLPGLHALVPSFARVTDAKGTNSHYTLSVIDFVDALVWAMVTLGR